jgi:hypothetical protein
MMTSETNDVDCSVNVSFLWSDHRQDFLAQTLIPFSIFTSGSGREEKNVLTSGHDERHGFRVIFKAMHKSGPRHVSRRQGGQMSLRKSRTICSPNQVLKIHITQLPPWKK